MNAPSIEKSFCTTSEAAYLLGVSVGTVQLWVENGLLVAWKTAGGHRRVMRDSVEKLLHKSASPAPAAEHTSPAPPTEPPANLPWRLSVLVVEDDTALLRLYRAKISTWPMRPTVQVIDNAFAALLMMGRSPPDLLISDLQMPSMDGFEMLRVITTVPEMAQTTTVVVSGLDAADIRARGGVPSGIEILPKPIPFDRLLAIADEIVRRKHPEARKAA